MVILADDNEQNDWRAGKMPDRYKYMENPNLSQFDIYKWIRQKHLAEIEIQQRKRVKAKADKIMEQCADTIAE